MGDGEVVQFGMGKLARGAAGGAPDSGWEGGEAITAQDGHGGSIGGRVGACPRVDRKAVCWISMG